MYQVLLTTESILEAREAKLKEAWRSVQAQATKMRAEAAAALVATTHEVKGGAGGGRKGRGASSAAEAWRSARYQQQQLSSEEDKIVGLHGAIDSHSIDEFVEEIDVLLREASGGPEEDRGWGEGKGDIWKVLDKPLGGGGGGRGSTRRSAVGVAGRAASSSSFASAAAVALERRRTALLEREGALQVGRPALMRAFTVEPAPFLVYVRLDVH